MMVDRKEETNKLKGPISDEDLQRLLGLLETIRFGSITLVVQDGKVIQIEKNEKMRLK